MNVAITGHTRGIGKAITDEFQANGHSVVGYSKSTGFDISVPEHRQAILDSTGDADIFVNNAFDPIGQYELLSSMIDKWEGTDKLIINLSSKGAFVSDISNPMLNAYCRSKEQQNNLLRSRILGSSPRVLNVVVGLVDTELSVQWPFKKINPTDLSKLIYHLTASPIMVQEIVLDVHGFDWRSFQQA